MAVLCSPSSGPCPWPVHYRPATPYMSMLLTNHPHNVYPITVPAQPPHQSMDSILHTGGSVVTDQPDSPSRICYGSLDEAARMVDRPLYHFVGLQAFKPAHVRIYMPLKHPYPHLYTHRRHFGPRVAHCPEATHVCIVRAPVPPPHMHVPAPPHTLTHPSHPLSLLLDVQRLSSVLSQASGMGHQAGLVLSSRTPTECISLTRC
jgi:hypothetical protein